MGCGRRGNIGCATRRIIKAGEEKMTKPSGLQAAALATVALGICSIIELTAVPAVAQGQLVIYCAVQEEWCRGMTTAFERQNGVKVSMTRKSARQTYAPPQAAKDNSQDGV